MSTLSQSKSDVCIVQIIWRADTHIIKIVSSFVLYLGNMAVKALKLGKEISIRKITINNTYTIEFVKCCNQMVSCFLDRFHVSRCDVSRSSNQCEVFHGVYVKLGFKSKDFFGDW